MGLSQGQLLSWRGGCYSKHWVSCQSRVHISCSKIKSTNCPGHELKDTDLRGGVYSIRHLSKVSLIGRMGLILLVTNSLPPLWPFICVQQCHPEVFSLASFFFSSEIHPSDPVLSDIIFPLLFWVGQELHNSALNQQDGQNTDLDTCFQNSLFVYLIAVFACVAFLCMTGRVRAKIPQATCFTKCCLSEAFLKRTKARSHEIFRLLL